RSFKYLWLEYDKREAEMATEERKRLAKIAKAPNAYRCATEGCDIEATNKRTLLRCSGKCPGEYKPSYCSKECQKRDWPVHKQICKPGSKATIGPADSDSTIQVNINDPSVLDNEIRPDGGVERIIEFPHPDVPGGKLRIKSKSLSQVVLGPLFFKFLGASGMA
ncbi:hypothetical protein DFH07DRAFT_756952, partial [Mycena maculata]